LRESIVQREPRVPDAGAGNSRWISRALLMERKRSAESACGRDDFLMKAWRLGQP
jgi:hypothetical protein